MKKRMKKLLSITLTVAVLATMLVGMSFTSTAAAAVVDGNPQTHVLPLTYQPEENVDYTGYFKNEHPYSSDYPKSDRQPKTVTRVNPDGTLTVCVDPAPESPEYPYVYIYEFDKSFNVNKTLKIEKSMPNFGSFNKDETGYYIFTADKDAASDSNMTVKNMSLNKYDFDGNVINSVQLNGDYRAGGDVSDEWYYGVMMPLDVGNCAMEITDSEIAVYFGRVMFYGANGHHQASYGFVFDKNTFERHWIEIPYCSHSFDQQILVDGSDFIAIDRGDGYSRGFRLQKFGSSSSFTPFTFKGEIGYNPTFSELAGLVKTSSGYLLAGSYENKNDEDSTSRFTGSRNLFVQTVAGDMKSCGKPIYLTDFNDKLNDNVAHPKVVRVGDNRNLIMWERFTSTTYKGTYYAVVDDNGGIVVEPTRMPDLRLNMYEPLRYNQATGKVNWAVNMDRDLVIYEFDPNNTAAPGVGVVNVTAKATDGATLTDAKITLNETGEVFTNNGDIHSMELPYGMHEVTVEREGYVTATENIYVYGESCAQEVVLIGGGILIHVQDGETNHVVDGVTARLEDGTILPQRTNGNITSVGEYFLNSKPAGTYVVYVEKEGYIPAKVTVNTTPGSQWITMVRLYKTGHGTLELFAATEDGTILSDATVVLTETGEVLETNGDAHTIELDYGTYEFTVSRDGYATRTANVFFNGAKPSQKFTVYGGGINFALMDIETKEGIRDAIVSLDDGTIVKPMSWNHSYYSNRNKPAGTYTGTFEKEGYLKESWSLNAVAGYDRYRVYYMHKTGPLYVRVTDPSGNVVTGKNAVLDETTTLTGQNGTMSFSGVSVGEHTITVSAPGYKDITVAFVMDTYYQYLDIVMLPLGNEDLKISGAYLTLEDNLKINYIVNKNVFEGKDYKNPYVLFNINGVETKVSKYVEEDGNYIFSFANIAPDKMNDKIYATLCASSGDEIISGSAVSYSVAEYCYNTLAKCTDDKYASLRTLIVDLLNYGAKSQLFTGYGTDKLVNSALTETQAAWGTSEDPVLESVFDREYATVENPAAAWKGAGLYLKDTIEMRFIFAADDINGMTINVETKNGTTVIPSSKFIATEGGYYVRFNGLNAGQLSEDVFVTVYKDGKAVSNTLRYSVESYAQSKQDDSDENLSGLVKAMMKYGNSAAAFAGGQAQ